MGTEANPSRRQVESHDGNTGRKVGSGVAVNWGHKSVAPRWRGGEREGIGRGVAGGGGCGGVQPPERGSRIRLALGDGAELTLRAAIARW